MSYPELIDSLLLMAKRNVDDSLIADVANILFMALGLCNSCLQENADGSQSTHCRAFVNKIWFLALFAFPWRNLAHCTERHEMETDFVENSVFSKLLKKVATCVDGNRMFSSDLQIKSEGYFNQGSEISSVINQVASFCECEGMEPQISQLVRITEEKTRLMK